MKKIRLILIWTVVILTVYSCGHSKTTPVSVAVVTPLFNGKNLDGWYTYLSKRGKNNDPEKVFSVQDGLIRVSGAEWGCITTNAEYENYSLEVEFKTGTQTYWPRKGLAFDSGLLLHSIGEDGAFNGAWMKSIECNIIDGGCGDFIVVALAGDEENFALTTTVAPPSKPQPKSGGLDYDPDGIETTVYTPAVRINRIGRDHEWQGIAGFRGKNEIENEHGEWNTIKCVAQGGTLTVYLNGKLVNKASLVKPQKGRIQIQSEGAEYFFKRIDLTPLVQ
ncbi:hypothetical protein FACS1894199_16110 [Bacteroidia bacterium]|nr:hypothetical protein FACS1894199_16110 [Bacteroidia bacterium]